MLCRFCHLLPFISRVARTLGIVAVFLLPVAGQACGSKEAAPQLGTVYIRVDSLTCTGPQSIMVYIDGAFHGLHALSPGQTSTGILVVPGTHTVEAAKETTSGTYTWPTQSVTVPGGGSCTVVLTC
jgi:hypothetical protein